MQVNGKLDAIRKASTFVDRDEMDIYILSTIES